MHELYVFVVRFFVFAVKNPHLGSRSQEICSAVVSAYEAIGKVTFLCIESEYYFNK